MPVDRDGDVVDGECRADAGFSTCDTDGHLDGFQIGSQLSKM
jgi:hypothetical protein